MLKNIFEERYDIATPIAGLTCKPLSILPETISPKEMSLARGGNGDEDDDPFYDFDQIYNPLDDKTVTTTDQIPGECPGNTYDCAPGPELLGNPGGALGFGGSGGSGGDGGTGYAGGILGESYTAPADSSGTQDQNGGALDNEIDDFDFWDFNWGEQNNNEGEDEDIVYPTLLMDEDDEGNDENECDVCGFECCEC